MLRFLDRGSMILAAAGAVLLVVLLFAGPSLIGANKSSAYTVGSQGSGTSSQKQSTGAKTTGTTNGSAAGAGAQVFASAGCGNCHTLKAARTTGTVGPNLDDLQPSASTVSSIVKSGGGGMPSFSGQLSDAQITAVAAYVSGAAGH
jgi:mono/diheme cytochrome c family protein